MDQLVAQLNNVGVVYLEAGDLRTALELLRDALRCTLRSLRTPEENLALREQIISRYSILFRSNNNSGAGESLNGDDVQVQNASTGSNARDIPLPSATLNETASTTFVYSNGIRIVRPYGLGDSDMVKDHVVSAIVIFNLAIVYHLEGISDQRSSVTRLTKAKSLYQKSSSLLCDANFSLTATTRNAIMDLLLMALSNNLAHVSYELSSYHESKRFFDRLVRLSSTIEPSVYGDMHTSSSMEQQKSQLLLNAIILRSPTMASAA